MPQSSIRVIVRAVRILDCLVTAKAGLGVTELSRLTGLSKSTVHNLVTTLAQTELLAIDGSNRHYRLGPKLVLLGSAFVESTDLRDVVLPTMAELRDLTEETVTLHVKVGDDRVIIAQVVSNQEIRRVLEVGATRPVHLGSSGILLISGMSDDEVLRLLKRKPPEQLTTTTVTDPRKILALIRQARSDGHLILNSQSSDGVGAIALPIHGHQGVVLAAIVVSGPIHRWNSDTMAVHLERMKALAHQVDQSLGYRQADPLARTPR